MAECIPGPNRFDSFDIFQTYYKDIDGHKIEVGILVPQNIVSELHPVFVKFHGGGCVSHIVLQLYLHMQCSYLDLEPGFRHMVLPQLVRKLVGSARPPSQSHCCLSKLSSATRTHWT